MAEIKARPVAKAKAPPERSLQVKVFSPYQTFFDEPARSISGVNETGPFDVLEGHHNFITLLQACELVIHTTSSDERRIRINGGLMHVKSDMAVVFLDV